MSRIADPPAFWTHPDDPDGRIHARACCAARGMHGAPLWFTAPRQVRADVAKVCADGCHGDYTAAQSHYLALAAVTGVRRTAAGAYCRAYVRHAARVDAAAHLRTAGVEVAELPHIDWPGRALADLSAATHNRGCAPADLWSHVGRAFDESAVLRGHGTRGDVERMLDRLDGAGETAEVTVAFDGWEQTWPHADPLSGPGLGRPRFWRTVASDHVPTTEAALLLGSLGFTPRTPTVALDLAAAVLIAQFGHETAAVRVGAPAFAGPVGRAMAGLLGVHNEYTDYLGGAETRELWDAAFAAAG